MEALASGASAVTATRRLARYLLEKYTERQKAGGKRAWPTPHTVSWDDWVASQWRRIASADPVRGTVTVLDEQQETRLWEKVIRESTGDDPEFVLLHTPATAGAARETWRLIHHWQIPVAELERAQIDDARVFASWARAFKRLSDRNRWLSACQLENELHAALTAGAWRPRNRILLVGFDELHPAQQKLTQRLRTSGVDIQRTEPAAVNTQAEALSCTDRSDEFESAACWCRELLQTGRPVSVGVIVDDLEQHREQLEIVFDQVLHPARSLSGGQEHGRAFHISLGLPLARYPLVDAALSLLRLLPGPRPLPDLTRLLHTPFIAGGTSESAQRALLDLRLRERGRDQVSLPALLRLIEREGFHVDALKRSLQQVVRYKQAGRRSPSAWAEAFDRWLVLFGWPGDRALTSVEYQTVQAWRELLGGFARLGIVVPDLDAAAAVAQVDHLARHRVFQARSEWAPVQILGVDEAAGMQFDHLWISGMSEDAWPAPTRPDPFLPYEVQRRFGLPGAVADRELTRYQRSTERLIGSASRVVVSFPRQRDEETLNMSALYRDLPRSDRRPVRWGLARHVQATAPELEVLEDRCGPPAERGKLRGGSGMFKDQAACPFRAFAHHRLAAVGMTVTQPGLSAAERGTLVHTCMAAVWRTLRTSRRLQTCSPQELVGVVKAGVDAAVLHRTHRDGSRLRERVLELERQRLFDLACEWLEIERKRRLPFEVEQIEQKIETGFCGLDLSVRVDRIDRLADGRGMVIDYKSGAELGIGHWLGDRPADPQLPLYLLSVNREIGAIAYARLRRGRSGYKGLAEAEGFAEGVDHVDDWPRQVSNWKRVLGALAEQLKSGSAAVDPKDAAACRGCDAMPLCRIFELPGPGR